MHAPHVSLVCGTRLSPTRFSPVKTPSDQLLPRRVKHNPVLNITMAILNAPSVNSNTQVSRRLRLWLFIGLVSFLCAFGIFTESQFYDYTIGIRGTYAHVIYFVVGATLSSAIQVLLIQPDRCKDFLEGYNEGFILKSCVACLVMFTVSFLSSGTGLPFFGLSSDGTAPNPAVAVAVAFAPYRSQAFSEIAGLLASSLLTVNAVSIIALLRPQELNTIFDVAATLTLTSAMALLYKYRYVTVVAAVFVMAMTLWKNSLCHDQVYINAPTDVSRVPKFWLFIGLTSFLCALGIFTESQFYAYTIGIRGTYAHIIYYVVGVTLFSAIQVLLIQPDCCKDFLEVYNGNFILKSFGGYFLMLTICFLSSVTGLQYLGLSSDGKAPSPAVPVALAPYRSQAFSEIAGLLASALLTVNALSIIILLKPQEHNTIFEIAATLTLESAMKLTYKYKYPYVVVAAAVFVMVMTFLKNFLFRVHIHHM